MESKVSIIKEICEKLKSNLNSNSEIEEEFKKPILEYVNKIKMDDDKKINLIFFGNTSSGKTSSINLLLRKFLERSGYENQMENFIGINLSSPTSISDDDNEYLTLVTAEAENTFSFTFIENSTGKNIELIFEIKDENERKRFSDSKLFEFQFNDKNQIERIFPNTLDGIKQLNEFLEIIDKISLNLLESARKNNFKKDNNQINKPSIITIKIPNFPEKYRIVDTPGLSTDDFVNNFLKIIDEFNFINVFILVQDISSLTTYNFDAEILKRVNDDYGKPFIYSFHTKGLNFIEKFSNKKKQNKEKEKEKTLNLKKSLIINNLYFNRIVDFKNREIFFRKIIPIIDNDYHNDNVNNNIEEFIDDVDKTVKDYGCYIYERCMNIKLRKNITDLNDKLSKESLLTIEEQNSINLKKNKSIFNCQNEIRDYFGRFDTFENYQKKYPDHLKNLNERYKSYEYLNDHNMNRNNYIKRHAELSIEYFQNLILEPVYKIMENNILSFVESLDKSILDKLALRLTQEGLIDPDSVNDVNLTSVGFGLGIGINTLIATAIIHIAIRSVFIAGGEAIAIAAGISWIPIVGWIIGAGTLLGTILYSTKHYYGAWTKEAAREDVSKALFEWFVKSKADFIGIFLPEYDKRINKFIDDLKKKKEIKENAEQLLKIVGEIKIKKQNTIHFEFKKEEYLKLMENEELKYYMTEALNLNEEMEKQKIEEN